MDSSLLTLVLIVLAFATALNLFLILRIIRIVHPVDQDEDLVPLVGQPLPDFEVKRRADGEPVAFRELSKGAAALIFLSAGCPACKAKIPEIIEILPAAETAGVALWVAAANAHHDIAALTAGSPLAARILHLDPATRNRLNPLSAAPIYLFIDEASEIRAGNYLGDENWEKFLAQMREVESTPE